MNEECQVGNLIPAIGQQIKGVLCISEGERYGEKPNPEYKLIQLDNGLGLS